MLSGGREQELSGRSVPGFKAADRSLSCLQISQLWPIIVSIIVRRSAAAGSLSTAGFAAVKQPRKTWPAGPVNYSSPVIVRSVGAGRVGSVGTGDRGGDSESRISN